MQAGRHDDRRSARAEALAQQLEEDPRVLYVGASLLKHGTKATAVVTTIDRLVTSASVGTTYPAEAEELAVALALATPEAKTMVTYSKTAYARYRRGRVSPAALAILKKRRPPGRAIMLVWVPAHSQVEGYLLADHHAREVSIRAEDELPHPATSYKELSKCTETSDVGFRSASTA